MKRIIALSLGAILLLPLVSCRRDSMTPEEAKAALRQPVTFTASIDNYAQVKGADESFEEGDAIGLYAADPFNLVNVRAVVKGNYVKPLMPFEWEMVRTAVFVAYYPYDPSYKDESRKTFAVMSDQRTYEAYKASDLRAAVALGKNGETVELPFHHMLSKLTVLVHCEDSAEQVTSVILGGVATSVTADFAEAAVETAGGRGDLQAGKAVAGNGNEGYVAILVPQTLSELPIMVATNKGQTLVFQPDQPLSFESGHAYVTSTLTVPKQEGPGPGPGPGKELTFSVSITDWADGGTMDFHKGKTN